MNKKQINFIDLFAGAGGMSEGFIQAGFNSIAHVEMNKHACDTLKTRVAFQFLKQKNKINIYEQYLKNKITKEELWSEIPSYEINSVINSEISKKTISEIFNKIDNKIKNSKIDLIIGGPPCQAYSIVGRARDSEGMVNDPRNHLYLYYIKFLEKYKPKMFVFENVPGILSAKNGEFFSKIKKAFKKAGYELEFNILNSKDFNVLQNRKRVILIGWKKNISFKYPTIEPLKLNFNIKNDLFFDLPKLAPGEGRDFIEYSENPNKYLNESGIRKYFDFVTQHKSRPLNENDKKIYKIAIKKMVKEGKRINYKDLPDDLKKHKNDSIFNNRFQVVDPFSISHTIVAHISCDGNYYIYPDLDQIRSISIREAARIQSFPDDYFFEGGQTAAFKQIGNAVPPLMAKGLAEIIKKYL